MTLFIVATPIGNLEDITYRAVRILSEADLIAAEDTRQTKKLLDRYRVKTPQTSYHKFNLKGKTGYLIGLLKEGKKIALVSDSGTPGISDPGEELIGEAAANKLEVVPIPGPCAAIAALTASGLPTARFCFVGFLPKKPGKRRKALQELKNYKETVILYESPYRIEKCLEDIQVVLGERPVVAAREITKIHEEFVRGNASEVLNCFKNKKPKGEIVLLIEGSTGSKSSAGEIKTEGGF